MINTARLGNGFPALNSNQAINVVAQYIGQDMIGRDYFSHLTLEGDFTPIFSPVLKLVLSHF